MSTQSTDDMRQSSASQMLGLGSDVTGLGGDASTAPSQISHPPSRRQGQAFVMRQSESDIPEDFGPYEMSRADRIPGHNRSVAWLMRAMEAVGGWVEDHQINSVSDTVTLQFQAGGSSTSLYRIRVTVRKDLIQAFEEKVPEMLARGDDMTAVLRFFGPHLFGFDVWGGVVADRNGWNGWTHICIESAVPAGVWTKDHDSHILDAVTGLVLALADDLNTAKRPEMYTLRHYLISKLQFFWLMRDSDSLNLSFQEMMDIGTELSHIAGHHEGYEEGFD